MWRLQGELVRDSGAIAARYMAFWFWVDIFASIPFDALLKVRALGIIFAKHIPVRPL